MNISDNKPSLLYITDLYYAAQKRSYHTEDIYITSKLKDDFNILLCHPLHSKPFEAITDLVVIRNSGPVIYYKEYYNEFKAKVIQENIPTYNPLTAKGDMAGKNYLVELYQKNFPVIPTFDSLTDLQKLPAVDRFVCKPKEGADSIGLEIISRQELSDFKIENSLVQPFIDFEYEVSFYFLDRQLMYALYAPDKKQRWQLTSYEPSQEDVNFAEQFVEWNDLPYGIQRVDACRTKDGELLLVELEDLNPFLSLDLLKENMREEFITHFKQALSKVIELSRK